MSHLANVAYCYLTFLKDIMFKKILEIAEEFFITVHLLSEGIHKIRGLNYHIL